MVKGEEYEKAARKLRGLKQLDEDSYQVLGNYAKSAFNKMEDIGSRIPDHVFYGELKNEEGINSGDFADVRSALECLGYAEEGDILPLEVSAEAYVHILEPPAEEYEGMLEEISKELGEQEEEDGVENSSCPSRAQFSGDATSI